MGITIFDESVSRAPVYFDHFHVAQHHIKGMPQEQREKALVFVPIPQGTFVYLTGPQFASLLDKPNSLITTYEVYHRNVLGYIIRERQAPYLSRTEVLTFLKRQHTDDLRRIEVTSKDVHFIRKLLDDRPPSCRGYLSSSITESGDSFLCKGDVH